MAAGEAGDSSFTAIPRRRREPRTSFAIVATPRSSVANGVPGDRSATSASDLDARGVCRWQLVADGSHGIRRRDQAAPVALGGPRRLLELRIGAQRPFDLGHHRGFRHGLEVVEESDVPGRGDHHIGHVGDLFADESVAGARRRRAQRTSQRALRIPAHAVQEDTLREEPTLSDELFSRIDVRTIGVDQVQHRAKLPQPGRELRNVASLFQGIALANHQPIGDLLEQVSEALVVRSVRVVVLADEEKVVQCRRLK